MAKRLSIKFKDDELLQDWEATIKNKFPTVPYVGMYSELRHMMMFNLVTKDSDKYFKKLKDTSWLNHYIRICINFLGKCGFSVSNIHDDDSFGYIYFISDGDHVKIGFSTNPKRRLPNLQVSTHKDLKLLFTIRGNPIDEKVIQNLFSEYHERGEWYSLEGRLKGFLDSSIIEDGKLKKVI